MWAGTPSAITVVVWLGPCLHAVQMLSRGQIQHPDALHRTSCLLYTPYYTHNATRTCNHYKQHPSTRSHKQGPHDSVLGLSPGMTPEARAASPAGWPRVRASSEQLPAAPPGHASHAPTHSGNVRGGGDGVGRAERLVPHCVEPALLVGALVRVRAEKVALRLHQVGGQPLAAVRVKVGQRRGEAGGGHALRHRHAHHAPPRSVALCHLLGELGVDEQVGQRGVARVRLGDLVQEHGADDAAALPDARQAAQVDAPLLLLALGLDDVEALRVGADLGRVQRGAHVRHQLRLGHARHGGGRVQAQPLVHLGRGHALRLGGRHVAAVQRRGDGGRGHAQVGRLLHGPLAGALGARLVHDLVHQEARALVVLLGQDDGGDLHQEGRQLALVPVGKHGGQLVVGQAAQRPEDVVRLADELHVAVLNAVVHHLDVVARAALANVHHARPVVHLRRHLLHDVPDVRVRLGRAARHHGGAPARALLAARHAHAHVQQALLAHLGLAALRVLVPLIATINDDVAGLHVLAQLLNSLVNRGTCLDQDDDTPGLLQRGDEVLHILVPSELAA
mmetsp:Transcript_13321/g.32540  ORF Transcript_13321/g.32540 Transcript_13321/m.32540 type:complete len:562 (-) Transcript_13321:464-2149(-)